MWKRVQKWWEIASHIDTAWSIVSVIPWYKLGLWLFLPIVAGGIAYMEGLPFSSIIIVSMCVLVLIVALVSALIPGKWRNPKRLKDDAAKAERYRIGQVGMSCKTITMDEYLGVDLPGITDDEKKKKIEERGGVFVINLTFPVLDIPVKWDADFYQGNRRVDKLSWQTHQTSKDEVIHWQGFFTSPPNGYRSPTIKVFVEEIISKEVYESDWKL